MNGPLVSVLMTSYNREKYLAAAIESVLNSSYKNWELLIVDDCSKDKTVEIARKYSQNDDRIKVFVNEKNLGDYPNRNKAASYANGKYLKYLDADDLLYPYGLEQLVFYMEQFPDTGYGLCSLTDDVQRIFPFQLSPQEAYKRHYLENKYLFHRAPLSSIIKREAFFKVGGFSGKKHVGDFELWHKLSLEFPVLLMPLGIVWYRNHDDQQMNDNRTDPFVPFKYLLLTLQLMQNSPLSEGEKEYVNKKVQKIISRSILNAIKSHSIAKAIEMKKATDYTWSNILMLALIK